jgi:hypothetical protein
MYLTEAKAVFSLTFYDSTLNDLSLKSYTMNNQYYRNSQGRIPYLLSLPHSFPAHLLILVRLPITFQELNRVDTVFFEGKYSIFIRSY